MQDFPDVDAYIEASDRWPDEIAALRPLLLETGLEERIKWGKPCYSLGDDNVVIIQEFADHLALMFFKGVCATAERAPMRRRARYRPPTSVKNARYRYAVGPMVDRVDCRSGVE